MVVVVDHHMRAEDAEGGLGAVVDHNPGWALVGNTRQQTFRRVSEYQPDTLCT